MSNTPSHLGGEEWRDMDGANTDYNPALSADTFAQARSNIESHRKGEIKLRLVDHQGKALVGVPVKIALQKHEFLFGEQLWSLDAMIRDGEEHTGKTRAWKQRFAEMFNASTNLCYWTERPRHDASKTEDRQGEQQVENFARTVEWTMGEGMVAKGHPLFWSIPKCTPDWVQRYDVATQMKFAEVRVRNLVARFKGKVRIWDAVNEPMWEAAPANLAKRAWPHIEPINVVADYIEEVMRWCREEDPDALYLVNDYGMEEGGSAEKISVGSDGSQVSRASQRKRYLKLFEELIRRGAAPDAIGLQSHSGWVQNHAQQWVAYDELTSCGLPIHITEFWAHTSELEKSGRYSPQTIVQMQAEYVANYITCAFGHPKVGAFFCWGVMGSAVKWSERSGHDVTPVYDRLRKLWKEEWHTELEATTDSDGMISFRGFYGEYSMRPALPSRTQAMGRQFNLTKGTQGIQEFSLRV